jgi:hypothetical protein
VSEAEITIPWLPLRVAAGYVASYLGCAEEDAKLRIVRKADRARGVTSEDSPVSLLPASWRDGVVDWDAGSLKSSQLGEITNVELCFGDLVAAGLLTTTALGRAWWTAAEALAWIIMGVPLALPEWAGLPELGSGMGQAGKELARAIAEGLVQARGRHGQVKLIPGDDLRSDMIEVKAAPAGPWPRVVVTVFGTLAISPPHRGRYKGPPWESIEVDSATLRQAFPKPLRAERWPLIEAEPEPAPAVEPTPPAEPKQPAPAPSSPQVEPEPALSPSEPSATRELPAEDVERQKLLQLPEEPQLEESRKWRPNEAQTWFESATKAHLQRPGENKSDYARRLYDHMKSDFGEDIPWSVPTLRRRLND